MVDDLLLAGRRQYRPVHPIADRPSRDSPRLKNAVENTCWLYDATYHLVSIVENDDNNIINEH